MVNIYQGTHACNVSWPLLQYRGEYESTRRRGITMVNIYQGTHACNVSWPLLQYRGEYGSTRRRGITMVNIYQGTHACNVSCLYSSVVESMGVPEGEVSQW